MQGLKKESPPVLLIHINWMRKGTFLEDVKTECFNWQIDLSLFQRHEKTKILYMFSIYKQ